MRTTRWAVLAIAACSSAAKAPGPVSIAVPTAAPPPSRPVVVAVPGSDDDDSAPLTDDVRDPPADDIPYSSEIDVADRCVVSVTNTELRRWTDAALLPPVADIERGRSRDVLRDELYAADKSVPDSCDVRRHAALAASLVAAGAARARVSPSAPWDHASPLAYHDEVAAVLALGSDDDAQLRASGLVVPERLAYDDYASAYYDIHRAQLPIFVTADSILHAIFISEDVMLARLEHEVLQPRLDRALGLMHCQLAALAPRLPRDVALDLDLYLTVARDLLAGAAVRGELSPDTQVRANAIVADIYAAGPVHAIDLFGRSRALDATIYTPRGHYLIDDLMPRYFRAVTWLSRLEFNLASRDNRSSNLPPAVDPSETPREAVDAMAFAQLARASGALADLDDIDRAWSAFAGAREDVSLDQLLDLMKRARIDRLAIPASADQLRAAIGDRFRRSINTFPSAEVGNLAVIATPIGPRITPDTLALQALPNAPAPAGERAAMLAYALGHDRALAHIAPDRRDTEQLDRARAAMTAAAGAAGQHGDLYAAWLRAILALADTPAGAKPSVMATPAFADLRVDSALAAYGQIRHANVLVAGQYYAVGGCEIPDGYVEPAPAVYDALVAWADRGAAAFQRIDRANVLRSTPYFRGAARTLRALARISRDELAGRPLTDDERRFLAMVVEERDTRVPGYSGTFPVATYDGWYLDLFPDTDSAFEKADFIADYATHIRDDVADGHWIDYLGARGPSLGAFVVDAGGAPRVMVGPVAHGFAASGSLAARFSDHSLARAPAERPWSASYARAAAPEPRLTVTVTRPDVVNSAPRMYGRDPGIAVDAPAALGAVTFELRDHHLATIDRIAATIHEGKQHLDLPAASATRVESVIVHVGAFAGRVDLTVARSGTREFGE